jgi:hypothetical protein
MFLKYRFVDAFVDYGLGLTIVHGRYLERFDAERSILSHPPAGILRGSID